MAVTNSLRDMIAIGPSFAAGSFPALRRRLGDGIDITFIPTFPRHGQAAGFCSTSRLNLVTVIWTKFLCFQSVYASLRSLRRILWPELQCRLLPMTVCEAILKTGPPLIRSVKCFIWTLRRTCRETF